MKIKNLLIITLILNYISLNGYTVNLSLCQKLKQPKNFLIQAGDAHFDCDCQGYEHPKFKNKKINKINKKHATELFNLAKTCSIKDCLFIVEDLNEYKGKNKKIKKLTLEANADNKERNFENCMELINQYCKVENIKVENVEFRQFEAHFFDTDDLIADELLQGIDEIVKEIESFNDNKFLNNYYIALINNFYKNNKKILKTFRKNRKKFYKDFSNTINENELDQFIDDLYSFLDAKIIHTIFVHKNKKYIFICAGISHIDNTNKILKQIGYQKIYDSNLTDLNIPIKYSDHVDNFLSEII